jgi:predicted RNase H-like HicB family nuclease
MNLFRLSFVLRLFWNLGPPTSDLRRLASGRFPKSGSRQRSIEIETLKFKGVPKLSLFKIKKRDTLMKRIRLTEEIWKEDSMYVSYCPELDISSCGKDILQAKKNLIEAIEINIEETRRMGTLAQFFEQCGIEETADDLMSARKELVGFTPIEVAI